MKGCSSCLMLDLWVDFFVVSGLVAMGLMGSVLVSL